MVSNTIATRPQAIIAGSTDAEDHFGISRFSMTNTKREELREKIAPFVHGSGVPMSPLTLPGKEKERRAELKKIAEACFPKSELDKLRATMHGETIRPFIIENLPLDTWDESKAITYRTQPKTRQLMMDVISEAIFAATEVNYAYNEVLMRRVEDHTAGKPFKGTDMHTDGYDVSMLSAVMNEEHAGLKLIDFASVIRSMPEEMLDKIVVSIDYSALHSAGYSNDTLADLNLDHFSPYTIINIDREFCDPDALEVFDRRLEENGIILDLQPGQLLCVNNRRIFHQGMRGTLQPAHTDPKQFTRVLTGNFANL